MRASLYPLLDAPAAPVVPDYPARVLALGPYAYWPCNDAANPVHDASGHGRTANAVSATFNQPGKYGPAVHLSSNINSVFAASQALLGAFSTSEYSFACWIKHHLHYEVGSAIRICNAYANALSEYSVVEIRSGNLLSMFVKEQGFQQVIRTDVLGTFEGDVWVHLVQFYSVSQNVVGLYYNGQLRQTARTTAGPTAPHPMLMECGSECDGEMQHLAFFDHKLTQAEVNALL